ncbi:hypothetical protein [Halanaerobium congolense]|jgi:hypothetical protein|uniref:Uncharacterized protein n=1 Tax=Halanaerobium congolense TaxID=54121 RepID=A0A1G6SBJ8_9FIRM|nr:hypothetical protein [Halanaerobium congolense]SDD13505.1 hypothetical protein SAMN04488597_12825 [Halanaerobium congolense]SHN10165.1 hypothetical protein SAMN04515650_12236 [Halanaerobium congolense]
MIKGIFLIDDVEFTITYENGATIIGCDDEPSLRYLEDLEYELDDWLKREIVTVTMHSSERLFTWALRKIDDVYITYFDVDYNDLPAEEIAYTSTSDTDEDIRIHD